VLGACSVSRRLFHLDADAAQFHHAPLQAVEEEVDDRSGKQRQHLGDDKSADDVMPSGLRSSEPTPMPMASAIRQTGQPSSSS